ncbi:polysaccharide biosynthesis C-terminal domain-containing protein [Desemzia sp. FAM 24101]|uniref:MATE family efflux transporter n=1 Tax=Desemzia sp. FAM 24101 TaxID=3259522 RepID=UPI00388AA8D4
MNRTLKLKLNTVTSLLNQLVVVISGLILPRVILLYYGSETNGLVSSISYFLSVITFLDLGVGSVVQSALYWPLAKKNVKQVSMILVSAKKFFQKIATFIVVYVIALMLFYPSLVNENIGYISTAILILSMAISTFARYYFGMVNELLLNADQRMYVQLGSEILTVILNIIASVILITNGVSIHMVKLSTSLIFLLRPIFLNYYVKKHYNINYNVKVISEPIKQKWNGMAQHIAYTVQNSTDIVVLSIFSTLENVSVYSVYNMVVQGLRAIILSLSGSIKPFFGNLLANDEKKELTNYFTKIEWLNHTIVIFLFAMTAALINSFVGIYTLGVEDINYYAPTFSLLLVVSQVLYCLRQPYHMLVLAAGHYKQTQKSSIIEATINVTLSALMVNQFGLIGVTIGTICAMVYRTLYLVRYLSKNIIFRPGKYFVKHFLVDIITFIILLEIGKFSSGFVQISNFFDWIMLAMLLAGLYLTVIFIINLLFYRSVMFQVLRKY